MSDNSSINGQVSIGASFFKKERDQAYSNPAFASWREHFQNADDAIRHMGRTNSGRIDASVQIIDDNTARIEVTDNGCGMDRNTLLNVFFKLGETTKGGEDTGGFGRARILTHFSQIGYEIDTRDLHVVGKGADFSIQPRAEYFDGCRMVVFVERKDRYGGEINWQEKLESFLRLCQFNPAVYVNGKRWTEWAYRRQQTRTLPFGTIHVNHGEKAINKGYVLVRVNGVVMFAESTESKAQVVFELDPVQSRLVLTSNRDGLNWQFRRQWDEFMRALDRDAKGATTEESNQIIEVEGTGTFEHVRGGVNVVLAPDYSYTTDNDHSQFATTTDGIAAVVRNPMDEIVPPPAPDFRDDSPVLPSVIPSTGVPASIPEDRVFYGPPTTVPASVPSSFAAKGLSSHVEAALNATETELPVAVDEAPVVAPKREKLSPAVRNRLFSIIVNDNTACLETEGQKAKVRRQIKSYNPSSWYVINRPGQGKTVTGGAKAKLLLLWKSIVHYVVDEYIQMYELDSMKWGVGWLFGPDAAERREHKEVPFFLLNPVDADGKMAWGLTDKTDLHRLIILAIHQVAHLKEKYHDEDFVKVTEALMARVLLRMPEIWKAIRKVGKVKLC